MKINSYDQRVIEQIQLLQLPYEMYPGFELSVTLNLMPKQNSQIHISEKEVIITSKTVYVGDVEYRQIYSICQEYDQNSSNEFYIHLLNINYNATIGSCQIVESNNESYLLFAAKINANSTPKELYAAISIVAHISRDIDIKIIQDRFGVFFNEK